MAGSNSAANGNRPKRAESATHADTAPGTVTVSQPRSGIALSPAKRAGVQACGARPEAFSPLSAAPSHTMANASDPTPFETGSTTVRVIAAAIAASTALPPRSIMRKPAWAASGCEVATTLRASTGTRREA